MLVTYKVLFFQYNKVTNAAFERLAKQCESVWTDAKPIGKRLDVLTYPEISSILRQYKNLDAILIGDIFWPTGQNICRYGLEHGIRCYFLQHGQWIYTANKQNPPFLPYCTFVYGDNVRRMCLKWPYGQRSKIEVTGNPRYDDCSWENPVGQYVYFAPPVMGESFPSMPNKFHKSAYRALKILVGIDKDVKMLLQPHYRETELSRLREMFPRAEWADPKLDPLPLIARSSRVLTHRNSTTVLDAIANGKLSVLMNGRTLHSAFTKGYFGPFAKEVYGNLKHMQEVLRCPVEPIRDYVQQAKPYLYLGNASQRILQLMHSNPAMEAWELVKKSEYNVSCRTE